MSAQGFGRKGGGTVGHAMPPRNVGFRQQPAAAPAEDAYAAQRAAFLAQERANGGFNLESRPDRDDGPTSPSPPRARTADKSLIVAYVLWLFVGPLAAHRFYCERYMSAVFQATTGLVGVGMLIASPHSVSTWLPLLFVHGMWRFVDLFLIPGMCRTPPGAR